MRSKRYKYILKKGMKYRRIPTKTEALQDVVTGRIYGRIRAGRIKKKKKK